MRTIQVNFMLVGKTKYLKVPDKPVNKDRLDAVRKVIYNQFGERPILIQGKEELEKIEKYPEYYMVGWFVGKPIHKGTVSELVVIEHGSSMEGAKKKLFNSMKHIDWDALAIDVE